MTLLVAWLGVDARGPSSAYITSDSRICWGEPGNHYDRARKVFSLHNSPDLLGYAGDVLFPSMTLGQIIELSNSGLLGGAESSIEKRFNFIYQKIRLAIAKYPLLHERNFQIVHIGRDIRDGHRFECRVIKFNASASPEKFYIEQLELPRQSGMLGVWGTGKTAFCENLTKYNKSSYQGTSRLVFHCFCHTLFSGSDPYVGGAPQLVGLFRKDNGISFGVISNSQRFYLGAKVERKDLTDDGGKIKCFNRFFERCSFLTKKPLEDAQRQPDLVSEDSATPHSRL